ncbi:MAG TPA: RNA polymerase sigma factor [Solirubrobacteraceae bacterium]|nr:RNA polymerase sigma factor [Solirubrobacteraceae bacterium]
MPLRTLSDERLAELASAGHSDAFGTLYERYRDALSKYCRSIVRDAEDAGDALQNTMLSVLRALQGRGPSGPVRPWLYRIAHNESITIMRRRHPHEELSTETPDRVDTEYASFAKARLDALLADLMALPERQRGALVMRELGGLEYSEIGDALNMSAVAARKHVFEARVALHDIADGRDTACTDIVRRISDGDGRVLRARSVRGHLRGCPSCSAFERGLRARRGTLALIPPLPLAATGAVLAAALHGGATTGSGLAAGSSVAGGSVAGGSIAAGSLAAVGSVLGGGSFAAVKGLIAAGAVAVAGAGVIVGTGISAQASHSQHSAAVVTHASRHARMRAATVARSPVAKHVHLATAHAYTPPAPKVHRVPNLVTTTANSAPNGAAVPAPPPTSAPTISKPNKQAPTASVPVAVTTPATTPTAPPATTTAPTTTPAAGASAASSPTAWINAIIASALSTAGADVAAAEAQVQAQLTAAGVSPTTVSSTIQGLIGSILSGGHP